MFWKWALAPPNPSNEPRLQLTAPERRVLSKPTSGAGGYLVPTDFESAIVQVLRTRSVMQRLARTATADATASWTAENAAISTSDETFGQVTIGAYERGARRR